MRKKLINWAECPTGVKVVEETTGLAGTLLETDGCKAFIHFNGLFDAMLYECCVLKLAPADQQPWLMYEEGVTVVPEWAVCHYRGPSRQHTWCTANYTSDIAYLAHYRIIAIKEGWTDNPNEEKK
jgi:hypothetical protein